MSGPGRGERGVAERASGRGRVDHVVSAAELGLTAELARAGPFDDRVAVAAAQIEKRILALGLDRRHHRLDQHSLVSDRVRKRIVRAEQEGVVRRG